MENKSEKIAGRVLEVNAFGHVMLSWTAFDFEKQNIVYGDMLTFEFEGQILEIPYCPSYSCVDLGMALLLPDPKDHHIYFSVNHGDARTLFGFSGGENVAVSVKGKQEYKTELEKRNYVERLTYHRDDYESDEVFGNFRMVSYGNIRPLKLFRSCAHKENGEERKDTIIKLIKKNRIQTEIDLTSGDTNIGFDFANPGFHHHLKAVYQKVAESSGPTLIHCVFGKDRTGAVFMILEGLMGATFKEIRDDYMESYKNLYHMKKDSEEWDYIVKDIFLKKCKEFFGISELPENENISVQESAEKFLKEKVMMQDEEISKLRQALS